MQDRTQNQDYGYVTKDIKRSLISIGVALLCITALAVLEQQTGSISRFGALLVSVVGL